MLRTSPAKLRQTLQALEQATLDHAVWRDHMLRVISGRRAPDPRDLAPEPHRRCLFGRWYFEHALPELRALRSFAMIGAEHEEQHRLAADILRRLDAGETVARSSVEEFEEASARLAYALYFIQREIECALNSRDALTDADNAGELLRDLREWQVLARQRHRQCSLALMALDDDPVRPVAGAEATEALAAAVRIVTSYLRLSDRVFRYDEQRFLIRFSGTGLEPARTVVARLREALVRSLTSTAPDGAERPVTASFGVALLDPDVDALESIDRADQALTLARAAGGNRSITWDPSVTTGRLRRLETKDVR